MNHSIFGFAPESKAAADPSDTASRFCLTEGRAFCPATTGDFSAVARNHCCATMLTSYCLYLRQTERAAVTGDPQALFCVIHRVVHNGPILILPGKAERALAPLGLRVSVRDCCVKSFTAPGEKEQRIEAAIRTGAPAALLVAAVHHPLSWHWVLALGAVSVHGTRCLLIADGWHRELQVYCPDRGCRVIRAYQLILQR